MSWIKIVLWVELAAFTLGLAMALGHKASLLPFKLAFLSFAASTLIVVVITLLAVVLLCISFLSAKWPVSAFLPHVVIGFLPLIAFFTLVGAGGFGVPKIHDISTRFDPAISFSKAGDLRKVGENPLLISADSKVQAAQQAYYADRIRPLMLSVGADVAFSQLKSEMEAMGWHIHASSESEGWIEAVDETWLFGFKDDIRIELTAIEEGVRVDARSVSRVGVSDLGANAKRIQRLWDAL